MTPMQRATEMIQAIRLHGDSIPKQLNDWLAKLPTVQWQAFISAMLALGTGFTVWICMLKEIKIELGMFIAWLGFVAAYGGIAYKQFAKKRDTYTPQLDSHQNADKAGI